MTEHELNLLLKQVEGTRLEFKEAGEKMPGTLFETIVGFLNKEGGTVLLGVTDNGQITGIQSDYLEKIRKDIVNACNNKELIDPPFIVTPQSIELDGLKILSIKVPVSSQVHRTKGIVYDRENDSDLRIMDPGRIGDIYFRKRAHFTELKIYRGLTIEDFDEKIFERARMLIRAQRSDHPWLEEDNHGLLQRAGMYRKDSESAEKGYTMAAVLIFGKDETIQSTLPAYKIDALVRKKDEDRYDDRITLRTNLIDSYFRLMDFIRKHLPDSFFLENVQRKDLRELIFREVVTNMIIHREYTNGEASYLFIFGDRVECTNPNTVRFRGYLNPQAFHAYSKNPLIGKFFAELGLVEEIGSGVRTIHRYLPQYADGSRPIFNEDDTFRTTLPLKRYILGQKSASVIELLQIDPESLSGKVLAALDDLSVPKELALGEEDFLFSLASKWASNGSTMDRIRMRTVKASPTIEAWQATDLPEKVGDLFGKRMGVLVTVLIRLLEPISLEDLMEAMEYRNRRSFVDAYLGPLMEYQLVERTHPKRPSHPEQKYRITEKGRRLLGGCEL